MGRNGGGNATEEHATRNSEHRIVIVAHSRFHERGADALLPASMADAALRALSRRGRASGYSCRNGVGVLAGSRAFGVAPGEESARSVAAPLRLPRRNV